MEATALAFVRAVLEGGWRLGVLILFIGGSILLADHIAFPKPDLFAKWLAFAGIGVLVGLAAILAAVLVYIVEWRVKKYGSRKQAAAKQKDALANLQTLRPGEMVVLRRALELHPHRFESSDDDPTTHALERKRIFQAVSDGGPGCTLYEVHPSIAAMKDKLLES